MVGRGESRRGFELRVEPDSTRADGAYAVTVVETNAGNERPIATLPPAQLRSAHALLADALRASKQSRTALSAGRRAPIPLDEASGVRVALGVTVIVGVSKPGRVGRLLDAVSRLSDEECFYWYAHTVGAKDLSTQRRRTKALRIFLTEE